ncbi:MAG: hypothetical protein EXR75_07760 [Myxococcales bacterium]|nr:hypothetical protein [Myxococcales bacterium]
MMSLMKTAAARWIGVAAFTVFAGGCGDADVGAPELGVPLSFSEHGRDVRADETISQLAMSPAGHLFVSGHKYAPNSDVGPNRFVARASDTHGGADVWRMEQASSEANFSIAAASDGGVFVAGLASADFELGPLAIAAPAYPVAFVVKVSADGTPSWTKYLGVATNASVSVGVAARPDGGVVATGTFSTGLTVEKLSLEGSLAGGGSHLYALSVAKDGTPEWLIGFRDDSVAISTVAVDADSGDVFLAGGFSGDINFGDGPKTSGFQGAVFFARLAQDGQAKWSRHYIGGGTFHASFVTGGEVFVSGAPWSYTDVGAEEAVSQPFLANFGASGATDWARLLGRKGEYGTAAAHVNAPRHHALTYVEEQRSVEGESVQGVSGTTSRARLLRAFDAEGRHAGEHDLRLPVPQGNDYEYYGSAVSLAGNGTGDVVFAAPEIRYDPNTNSQQAQTHIIKLRAE